MKLGLSSMDELCYAAEGLSGTAASSALRTLGSIMERAPSGRLFDAISTLSDMSAKAAKSLEAGSLALDGARNNVATARLTEALIQMDDLAAEASPKKTRRRAAR
jgi:hypothetical protein